MSDTATEDHQGAIDAFSCVVARINEITANAFEGATLYLAAEGTDMQIATSDMQLGVAIGLLRDKCIYYERIIDSLTEA